MNRFFLQEIEDDVRAILSRRETHHLLVVTRHGIGDHVELYNRQGVRYRARIEGQKGDRAVLEIVERLPDVQDTLPAMGLAQGILKGKRMDILVEKAVELGVTEIVPVVTARTIVQVEEAYQQKCRRWQRKMDSAVKQSGRASLPALLPPIPYAELTEVAARYDLVCIAVVNEHATPLGRVLRTSDNVRSILFVIGPEGGFTRDEIARAHDAGWRLVGLGPAVLRGETAGIAALAGAVCEFHARA